MNKKEKTIGEKIKAWRKKKDLTQDALAKKTDIPHTTLAKIESDVIQTPSLKTITKIAGSLGITLDDLIKEYLEALLRGIVIILLSVTPACRESF